MLYYNLFFCKSYIKKKKINSRNNNKGRGLFNYL